MGEVRAERVEKMDDLKKPGQFLFTKRAGMNGFHGLMFVCPCGKVNCRGDGEGDMPLIGHLPFETNPDHGGPRWKWDGNVDTPTLTPSVQRADPDGCQWHGYLTAGEWRSV